jgi:glyoxylase-like metal-dependent hydrolase (beta-lactamase superfamily II)
MIEPLPLDDRGSFAWIADAGDPMTRSSCAVVVDGGCLVVDPVDVPGLDEALSAIGPVLGVVTLLDRHQRDAAILATRLGAERLLPLGLGGSGLHIAGVEERTVSDRRIWHESLLWLPDRRLLVCAETLATADAFLLRADDRLGMHPLARIRPPRRAFAGIDPLVIAVGHGPPLRDGASEALRQTLRTARRSLPRHWARLLPAAVRASRSARRVRR